MIPCRRRAIWAAQAEVANAVQPVEVPRETQDETRKDADAETNADAVLSKFKHACVKCGKEVRRGMYFHQKYCKGL